MTNIKSNKIIAIVILLAFLLVTNIEYLNAQGSGGTGQQINSAINSMLFPGMGQLGNNNKFKGYLFIGIGAALIGSTIYMHDLSNESWDAYNTYYRLEEKNIDTEVEKYKDYANNANITEICLGVTIAFWTYNAIDAFMGASGDGSSPKVNSAVMSLLFPGLGQKKNGSKLKSYIFMGTGAALLGSTLYMHINSKKSWYKYIEDKARLDHNTDSYKDYKKNADIADICFGVTTAFWTYNIIDAYIGAD